MNPADREEGRRAEAVCSAPASALPVAPPAGRWKRRAPPPSSGGEPAPCSRKVRAKLPTGERATMTLKRTSLGLLDSAPSEVSPACSLPAGGDPPPPAPPRPPAAVPPPEEDDRRTARQQNTVPPTLSVMGWPHRGGLGRNSLAIARSVREKKSAEAPEPDQGCCCCGGCGFGPSSPPPDPSPETMGGPPGPAGATPAGAGRGGGAEG